MKNSLKMHNFSHDMTYKLIPPAEREAFEKEIAQLLTDHNMSDVARLLQKEQSTVSRAFSPYEERVNNPVYQFLLYLWAFDAISDGLAEQVQGIVCRERDKWLQRPLSLRECPSKLTGSVGKEYVEAIEKEMQGATYDVQIKEWADVESAAAKKKADVIDRRNEQQFGTRRAG